MIGCESNSLKKPASISIECPSILYAKEHRHYIGTSSDESITLENITFKAKINNVVFTDNCFVKDNDFYMKISILFLINSLDQIQDDFSIPFYLTLIDQDNNFQNIQYFLVNGKFIKNNENNTLIETEIIVNKTINFNSINKINTLVLGFVLDQKRLNILN